MLRKFAIVFVCIFAVAIVGCERHSELHEAMEDMGDSLKAMSKAESIDVFKADVDGFIASLEVASKQAVKAEDQAAFDEGMKKALAAAKALKTTTDAGSLEQAKATLKQLKDLRKKYHKKLGVKKD